MCLTATCVLCLPPPPRVRAAAETSVVVKYLRAELDTCLENKIRNPNLDFTGTSAQVVGTMIRMLLNEGKAA